MSEIPLFDDKAKIKPYGATNFAFMKTMSFFDENYSPRIPLTSEGLYMRNVHSHDDFGELRDKNLSSINSKVTRTGRQRKKLAARTKGGEFEAKRKKRRVNFCCICSELDLEGLYDSIIESKTVRWEAKMYEDVLHIFQHSAPPKDDEDGAPKLIRSVSHDVSSSFPGLWREPSGEFIEIPNASLLFPHQSSAVLWESGAKEVFIFEFGAVVFWGFRKGEEEELISLIRQFVEQGLISSEELDEEADDMAFVTSSDIDVITIANDVITLPDDSRAKSRLSVSFAIAQSAVLGIFEARVETKIKEFKYIPETLADNRDLQLTPRQLGTMIGEVYRIRHDVNLHSEILDTPDFFWKEEDAEVVYRMACRYLELSARTDVLNTRVDMLRELLAVLQQRQDNASAVKLEWIVIWLIVVSAAIESCAILVSLLKKE